MQWSSHGRSPRGRDLSYSSHGLSDMYHHSNQVHMHM